MTLFAGLPVPTGSFRIVLCHPFASVVHEAETILSLRVTLFGSLAAPAFGFRIILRNSLSFAIHVTEVELGFCVSTFGGFAVPTNGLDVVLRHSVAVVIHRTQPELRLRITLHRPSPVHCRPFHQSAMIALSADDYACTHQNYAGG